MTTGLSPQLKRLLTFARDCAAGQDHEQIAIDDLLTAMLHGSGAANALEEALDISQLKRLRTTISRHPGESPRDVPYSGSLVATLNAAMNEASERGDQFLGTGHVLLALLRSNSLQARNADLILLAADKLIAVEAKFGRSENEELAVLNSDAANKLAKALGPEAANLESISLVADLDVLPTSAVAEFLGSLDALHRAWGGGGLVLRDHHIGSVADSRALA
jgi:ATP-dependent Clp protease ATP-binding subunit ClpA